MIKVALRGLAGRKLRAVLTAIAIVLGVAMISGTYILTDTIDRAFTTLFTESYAGTDAVVTGKGLDISIDGETPPKPPVAASLLETVRGVDGVALASGAVIDERYTKILNSEGEAVSSEGAPTFGFGVDTAPALAQFNPLSILEGRWAASANEVVIDAGTADDRGYQIGDTVEITTLQPKRPFKLVGVARYGSVDSLGNASFAVFTVAAAQVLLEREGQYDTISVAAEEGVTEDELVAAIAPVLPTTATVVSATAEAAEAVDEVNEFTAIFRYFLLVFAGIALFVGAFVIFNTFSITVAQRTREFATLRTIGASRRQILGSVILESLVIGLLASLIGLGLGILLAEGIEGLFRALGVELPTADRVFAVRTVIVALAVGVGITLLAGLFPAIKATRVPPIAAVREGATLPKSRLAPFVPWIGGLVIVVALAVLARAMFTDDLGTSDRLLSIAAGVVLLFLGVASLASHIVRPLAAIGSPIGRWAAFVFTVLVWPLWLLPYWLLRYGAWGPGPVVRRVVAFVGGALLNPLLLPIVLVMWLRSAVSSWEPEWPAEFPGVVPDRVAARTGGENARRNPSRTAATAAALMIGIALVAFIATLTNGMKASNREAIEEQIAADYVVTSLDGYTPFVTAAGEALEASPVPEVVTSVRSDGGLVNDVSTEVGGIEPDTIAEAYVFDWSEGDDSVLATLGTTKAIVSSNYAEDHDISVGDVLTLRSTADRSAKVTVVGTFDPPPFYPLIESVNVSTELFDRLYDRPRNRWTWANVPGEPTKENRAQMEQAISGFPDTQLETREEWIDREDADFNEFISFLYVMLTLAVFVSVFGMINTLVLSVYERTREIGMLRAIGMTRRQVRRMIRQESIITALIGAAIGLPLGIFLAALVNRALSEFDVRFAVPWIQLAVLTIVAIIVGILAAIMPARRAAKLNPLEALHYE
ncbi:ABC transporter permease [Gaiella sp.]|uniref:ABC transporter permease n=1 Tax=Gaiella sp. TaxID=2663207 RepID=UPI00398380B9